MHSPLSLCKLCGRPLGDVNVNYHHLMPKTFKGKSDEENLQPIHQICHRYIHATLTERELQHYYHTFERLLEREEIQSFVKWVKKKEPGYYASTHNSNSRKR